MKKKQNAKKSKPSRKQDKELSPAQIKKLAAGVRSGKLYRPLTSTS